METDRGETLGQFLKREREERLVSIRAAARALGVEPLQIEALEAEDDRAFPDGDTLRVVLGLYAKFLLLDEAQLLQRMGRTRSRRHREPRSVFPKQEKPPRPRWALPRIIGWVVGVALLLAGVYVLVWAPSELVRKEEGQVMRYLAPEPLRPAPAPTGAKIVGNRDSKRYHLPGMRYYDKVEAYRRVEFNSEQEAIAAGYQKAPR